MRRCPIVALSLAAVIVGCSSSRMATRQAIDLTIRALPVYDREPDVEFGGQAVAGQLKLLEGLLESAPNDPDLLLALARSYARYAYGPIQLKAECAGHSGHSMQKERYTAQAVDFYARARRYGSRLLELAHPGFGGAITVSSSVPVTQLEGFGEDQAEALFWTAFAWGNELAAEPVTSRTLALLARAASLMQRVIELDERVMCGGAHLYLGTYYGRLPPYMGGGEARAAEHFRRAREISAGLYRPALLLEAEHTWHTTGDKESYIEALREIADRSRTPGSDYNLDNAVARRKAAIRLATVDSTFVCYCAGQALRPGP